MFVQRSETVAIVGTDDTLTGDDYEVKAHKLALLKPETLADQPLYPIANDGTTADLFRDRQTQSRLVKSVGDRQHQETAIDGTLTIVKNPTKIVGFQ
jgi:hypothetical protein